MRQDSAFALSSGKKGIPLGKFNEIVELERQLF
jgi:hypothetical protein